MNLKNIKAIVNSGNEYWEEMLISELATDENVVPMILRILETERKEKSKLIKDSNAELSRALVTIIDDNYGKKKAYIDRMVAA